MEIVGIEVTVRKDPSLIVVEQLREVVCARGPAPPERIR